MPHLRPLEPASKASHFQPHIQGLRAVAVLLVMLYHFWPGRVSGGYIGVDVFFVISGFLITGQLARELERTGKVKLPTFWAKRARRLLPASITVLVFSSLATIFFLPISALVDSLKEILASTFYFENWQLAVSSVDYLGSHDATMVQHYWSLSLEEQFYVIWPLLLLGATWLGVKYFSRRRWLPLMGVVVVVSVLSLIASVLYTQENAAAAYFVTFTRMWEFGAGAILALMPRWRPRGAWWPNLIGYAGLAAVLYAGYFFNKDTFFPGSMALIPVIGTAMVIASDRSEHWWDIGSVLSGPPQRFLGDTSYSLYLWHWPLIIIAPYIAGWGLHTWNRFVLFASCFLLAWLTKILIEDPTRNWRFLAARKARVTAAFTVGLMVFSAVFVAGAYLVGNPKYEAAAAQLAMVRADPPACFGAVASPACQNAKLAGVVIPNGGFGNADMPGHGECFIQLNESALKTCQFGSTAPDAPRVAVIGDSHAYQYIEPLIQLAKDNGWALTTYFKGGCPWTTTPIGGTPSLQVTNSCVTWQGNLERELATIKPYDAIFTAALWKTPYVTSSDDRVREIAQGYASAWAQARGTPIVTIVDNPDFEEDPNKCLRLQPADTCTEPRRTVLPKQDPIAVAANQAGAILLDFTDKYCDETKCFSVVGGANVYRDPDHLTNTWAGTLKSFFGDALKKALAK